MGYIHQWLTDYPRSVSLLLRHHVIFENIPLDTVTHVIAYIDCQNTETSFPKYMYRDLFPHVSAIDFH